MASIEIALVCGLKFGVDCQDNLCVNLDADETLAQWETWYVKKRYLTIVKRSLTIYLCKTNSMF